jgi:hypothetical protein
MVPLRAKINCIYCQSLFDAPLANSSFDGSEHCVFAQCEWCKRELLCLIGTRDAPVRQSSQIVYSHRWHQSLTMLWAYMVLMVGYSLMFFRCLH